MNLYALLILKFFSNKDLPKFRFAFCITQLRLTFMAHKKLIKQKKLSLQSCSGVVIKAHTYL